jgi:hypothetical protein
MQPARPLRDVLTDLVGAADAAGPADVLAANGHADLPDELVAEAVGSFADPSPIEVAEHLSPYVMANSPVPQPDAPPVDLAGWLDAVTGAPPPAEVDPTALLDDGGAHHGASAEPAGVEVGDLAFGHGQADHHVSTVDSFGDGPVFDSVDGTGGGTAPDPADLDDLPDHFPDQFPDLDATDDDADEPADDTDDA